MLFSTLRTRHKEELYDGKWLLNMDPNKLICEIGFRLAKRETFIIPECNPTLSELINECWNFDPEQRPSFIDLIEKLSRLESSLPECDELEYDVEESDNEEDDEEDSEEDEYNEDGSSDQVQTDEVYQDGIVSSEHAFNLQTIQETERPEFNPQDISIPNLLF